MSMTLSRACGALAAAALASTSLAGVVVPGNGNGSITFPHPATTYTIAPGFSPVRIIDGLPPGTRIDIDLSLGGFFNHVENAGGSLGGHTQQWQATSFMPMTGVGALAGYNRNMFMPMQGQTHTGPRVPFTSPQSFATDMFTLQGQVVGDPDFDLLRITVGTGFGMPSPGHTTLTHLGGDQWHVDSFFDIVYRIDFIGAPGSALASLSGSTTGETRIWLVPAPAGAGLLLGAALAAGPRRRRA